MTFLHDTATFLHGSILVPNSLLALQIAAFIAALWVPLWIYRRMLNEGASSTDCLRKMAMEGDFRALAWCVENGYENFPGMPQNPGAAKSLPVVGWRYPADGDLSKCTCGAPEQGEWAPRPDCPVHQAYASEAVEKREAGVGRGEAHRRSGERAGAHGAALEGRSAAGG